MEQHPASSVWIRHQLDENCAIFEAELPKEIHPNFDTLWNMHPERYHEIMIHGRVVNTPRWQQAYGVDYHYSGEVNKALPLPTPLTGVRDWCRQCFDARLNGVLLNWYDGSLGHYIGAHRDSTKNLILESPIVTVSLGEERVFRLRPWKGKGMMDFVAKNGSVFVMPTETNSRYTHEVTKASRFKGKRLSITLRAFS